MVAFTTSLPNPIVGSVTRANRSLTSTEEISVTGSEQPQAFGVPVLLNSSGKIRQLLSTDTSDADVYGFVVRSFPHDSTSNTFNSEIPAPTLPVSILRSGYVTVQVDVGSPINGSPVYARYATNGALTSIGGIVGNADLTAATSGKATLTFTATPALTATTALGLASSSFDLNININGGGAANKTVACTAASTLTSIAAAFNALPVTGATVTAVGNALVVTSATTGTGSTIALTAGTSADIIAAINTAKTATNTNVAVAGVAAIPHTRKITNAIFTGAPDQNGVAEISFNI